MAVIEGRENATVRQKKGPHARVFYTPGHTREPLVWIVGSETCNCHKKNVPRTVCATIGLAEERCGGARTDLFGALVFETCPKSEKKVPVSRNKNKILQ